MTPTRAVYVPHIHPELHPYAKFFPVSNPEDNSRILTVLIPSATRLGTVEELNNLRALVVDFQEDESVVRPYQWGMMDQEWMLALQLNWSLHEKTNDLHMIAQVFRNSGSKLARSRAVLESSHPDGRPYWMFQVGNTVTHTGGLFLVDKR